MKAKELMIGDWVYDTILKGNTRVEILSSSGIRCDFHENVWNENTFEPIPITPEILERNGFKARGYEELVLEADEYCFALQKGVDGINAWWWEMFSSPIIPINHVHELQHCLKMVGIDKEIVL